MSSESQGVHSYSDKTGTYEVHKLFSWVNQNPNKCRELPINLLLECISHDSWSDFDQHKTSNFRAIMEDENHRSRMMKVDLQYPIIISNFNRLIDGVHRIFRSIFESKLTIKAIFVDQSILSTVRIGSHKPQKPSNIEGVSFPDRYLTFPKTALPSDPDNRRDTLHEYFPDLLPSVTEMEDGFEVCLERPSTPYGCYDNDENIRQGLSWWKEGTRVRDIPKEYRLFEEGILALEEQWIPLSWSNAFTRLGKIPDELILLHLDDHRDMMFPRIGKRLDGQLIDYMTGDAVDFLNPESISKAIISGAIGKGSILTPLIWSVPKIHVRHLSFRPQSNTTYHIDKTTFSDGILFEATNRISLQFQDTNWDNLATQSNYVVSSDINTWLRQLPKKVPILLHFDLDYFNNRFDGCSDWKSGKGRSYECAFDKQQECLTRVFSSLRSEDLISSIIDTSIGISPSFYPAEFWSRMIVSLNKEMRASGLKCNLEQEEKENVLPNQVKKEHSTRREH